jgi:hypothetical protein
MADTQDYIKNKTALKHERSRTANKNNLEERKEKLDKIVT